MPQRGQGTKAISTDYLIEVFDWDDEYPATSGDAGAAGWGPSSLGNLINADKNGRVYGYVDRDLLMSFDVDSQNNGLLGSPSNTAALASEFPSGGNNTSKGVVSVAFGRSKGSVDGKCHVSVVGPLPHHTRIGNWVIVNSVEVAAGFGARPLPRFIGQIQQISTEYSVMANGAIVLRSEIIINEWSNFLNTSILFDLRSMAGLVQNPGIKGSSIIQAAGDAFTGEDKMGFKTVMDAATKNLNPYTAAKAFLKLVGLLQNQSAALNISAVVPGNSEATDELYKVASTMPAIPQKLLDRMGIKASPSNAFASGFVEIVAGRREGAEIDFPLDWDGFFATSDPLKGVSVQDFTTLKLDSPFGGGGMMKAPDSGNDSNESIASYKSSFNDFASEPDKQPFSAAYDVLVQVGQVSIWDLITSYCDPSLNEYYTDIWYEIRYDGTIKAQPVVVVRGKSFKTEAAEAVVFDGDNSVTTPADKPESGDAVDAPPAEEDATVAGMKKLQDAAAGLAGKVFPFASGPDDPLYKTWDYYEDLPRIQLDSALIVGMSLVNSAMTSPNLFTLGVGGVPDSLVASPFAEFSSMYTKRHDPEAARFGSIPTRVSTQFVFVQGGGATLKWFDMIANLNRVWDGYLYRMASGILQIKDPGLPLSVGFNLEFDVCGTSYVVHIDSVNVRYAVAPSGQKTSFTSIGFSRMMRVVNPDDGRSLEFCPPSIFGDLWNNGQKRLPPASLGADLITRIPAGMV